ncbi:MAG: efflux RND transporter periplasmic adaptor subunit [Acidobacteriia bacterium]|nr:efflux RND transporter periplasmic adaptor subunit [Terriglobia bacterium]
MATIEAPIKPQVAPVRPLPPARSKRRRRLWMIGAGGVALVLIILALLPPKVPVTHLSQMTLRDEAAGTGFVHAKVSIGVGAKINGVVLKVYVDQGDVVRKGQILAKLHNQDFQSQLGQATSLAQAQQAAVTSARANLSASEARLHASISAVARAQAGLRLAEINYKRTESLHEGGVVSKESLDTAETAYTQAQEDLRNSQAMQNSAQQEGKAAEGQLAVSQKTMAGSEADVRFQKANLQYTIVTSPVDGYVVSRDLEEGATVVPGLPIFTIAESSLIWVSANIDEREIEGLKGGQPATITLRSAPTRKISGHVARIAKEADPVTEEVVVDAAFAQRPLDIKLNETAEVYILKSEKAGAKALPRTAIVSGRDGPAVWIVTNGKLQLRPIGLGMTDKRGLVEVLNGLSDSEQVLVQPSAAGIQLTSGRRVRTSRVETATAGRGTP